MSNNGDFSLAGVRETARLIAPYIRRTPVFRWRGDGAARCLGHDIDAYLKCELFQVSGTFKARGVISVLSRLSPEIRAPGITGFSAGNHAIALAYAGSALGVPAKVVMVSSANPARRARAANYGAELIIEADAASARARAEEIVARDGMTLVHPFEGLYTVLGTGTMGLEIVEDIDALDAIVVGVGGGGLAAGVATAAKLARPEIKVYGIEPEGAPVISRSLAAGAPVTLTDIRTIADSLAPPFTGPTTFALCRDHLDDVVTLPDSALIDAMRVLYDDLKLAVEPGGVAALAGAIGPLRQRLKGKRVAIILCGSNIDLVTFQKFTAQG